MNRSQKKKLAALLGIPASLVLTRAVWAQTSTWTGASSGSPNNLWTDATNWDTGVPGASDTASFSGSASGNTTISLGGTTQSVGIIQFVTATAGYTLGVLGSGDTFNFESGGSLVVGPNFVEPMVVNANITTNGNFTLGNNVSNSTGTTGLTIGGNVFMAGGGTLTLDSFQHFGTILISGNISDSPTNAGSLSLTTTPTTGTAVNNFIFTGNNTYSGTTLLSLYTGSGTAAGSIEIGTDSAFGTGKVTLVLHGNAPNFSSYNGSHTITNNFDFNGGPVFIGTNSLTFTGSMNIINSAAGGTRALNNEMSGGTVYFGTAGTSSTITIGNPVSNGGDGVGKGVLFASSSNPGTTVVYDIIQDPGPGGGTSSGTVNIQQTDNVTLAGLNTYTGNTTITSNGNVIGIGSSSNGPAGSFTAGPFGTGTIILNNAGGQHLRPIGGNQTVANPVTMSSGLEMDNATGDSSNLTFSGPITVGSGTLIQNGIGGTTSTHGTFILGSANAPSTISMNGSTLNISALNGPVVVNDVIQGGTPLTINAPSSAGTGTGVVTFAGTNTYSTATTISGGTLSVSSDSNLGNTNGAVTFNGGSAGATLLSTGTFSSARTVNLNGIVNIIDATGTNVLTLTGALNGSGDLTKGTNSGTLQLAQPSGYSLSGNVNVNGGALLVGATSTYVTSTSTGNLTVTSGGMTSPFNVAGAVTVTNGSRVALNPSTPGSGVTNSAGSLNIGAGSSLDIGNHTVIVQNAPDETVIGGYLANGYAAAFWNGTSATGGSIISIVAYNDNSGATSVGFGNSADFTFGGSTSPYAVGGPKALSGNQVVVQPALAGDLLLTGSVGPNELALLLASYGTTTYDGTHKNTWAYGNIDYSTDGLVGPNDLGLLLANYGHSSSGFVSAAKSVAVSHSVTVGIGGAGGAAGKLTGTVSPAVNSDAIELDVNLATGDVQINGNNATDVSSLELASAGGGMVGNTTFTAAFNALFPNTAANSSTSINPYNTFATGSTVNGLVDMGDIYNTSLNTEDLTFQFSEKNENRGGLVSGNVVYTGVPEPTTLGLMGLAMGGLLARRRKTAGRR